MKRKDDKNYVKLLSLLTIGFVFLLSIGYSSFSMDLSITGAKAEIRADVNVRVTGVSISSTANGGASSGENYDVSKIFSDVRLPQSNSSITYEVEVKNYGNVEMGIESITLPQNLQNKLDVTVTGYTLGDKIRDNSDTCENSVDGCRLSIKRRFNVTLTYKNGAYNSNEYIFNNVVLDFTFKEMHKVIYTGFTVMHPSMTAYTIMDGHTYSYNIGPFDTLLIKIGGVITTNYTVNSSNVLTVPNVTDDLEIIISEVMLDFRITTTPNDARIDYTIGGVSQTYATGVLNTQIAIGSQVTVTVSKYGYRTATRNYTISNNVTDTFTLDQVYYLNVSTDLSDANIAYTVNGVAKPDKTQTLSDEYDPGTVIVATITRPNFRTEYRTYTMNQHITENITMVRQYIYKAIARTPASQNITMTIGGSSQTITSGTEYAIDTGTSITITASASGYRTKTISHTMTGNVTDTIDLTKTYIYTIGTVSPSNASLTLNVKDSNNNQIYNGTVHAGDTYEADIHSKITLSASATNYKSETYSTNDLTSNHTQNVSLTRLYTYTVTCSNKSDANISITYDGSTYTATGTKSLTVEAGKSVSWSISRNYYKTQSGSTSSVSSNVTQNKSLSLNDSVPVSEKRQDAIGLGSNGSYTISIPDGARIVSASLSGSARASVIRQKLTVQTTTSSGETLWNKQYNMSLTSYSSVSASYSCSTKDTNIEACPYGTVTTNMSKGSAVIIHIEDALKTTVNYIPK